MTASPSIVLASLSRQASRLRAGRSDHFETMPQARGRWRGPGSLRIPLKEGTRLQEFTLNLPYATDPILPQQPDLPNCHPLRRRRATPLRSPRGHTLHLSLLRRRLPRPVPRVHHQTSQPPRGSPRSLLLRPRIPLQRRLLSPPSTQQTQKRVGARRGGGEQHGINALPHGMPTNAAERHTGVLHGRTLRLG